MLEHVVCRGNDGVTKYRLRDYDDDDDDDDDLCIFRCVHWRKWSIGRVCKQKLFFQISFYSVKR